MYLPEELYQIYHSSNLVPESGLFIDTRDMKQRSTQSRLPAGWLFASTVPFKGWWKALKQLLRVWLERIKHCIYYKSNTPAESSSVFCCFPPTLSEFVHGHLLCVSPPHAFFCPPPRSLSLSLSPAISSWHTPTYTHFVSLSFCQVVLFSSGSD